ncbi:MAG TPA: hypothetical protein VJU16_04845 [Planctomycetota bacterium]|nr:hypothetical protein [Planctomycetota bacterium]
MRTLTLLAAFLSLQEPAFDFGRIERKIKSEPKFEMAPRYALLMLGDEGKIRMWMAMDVSVGDDIVYIDRDGDGALGEEGERFVAKKDRWGNVAATIGKVEFPEQKFVLEGLEVYTRQFGEARPALRVSFRLNGKVYVHGGQPGLEWGDSPLKAPILHADPFGTLTFRSTGPAELQIDQEETVTLAVGNWGSGPNTFCTVDENFLDLDKDKLFVTVIAKDSKGNDLKARFQLKEHC